MDVRTIMRRAVDAWGDRVAVVHRDRRLTFAEAWDRGTRLANILLENGVNPGDRVACLEDNTLEAADFYLACTIANFVRVPLYVRNAAEAHLHMVSHTGCKAIVVDPTHEADGLLIADAVDSVGYLLLRDGDYEGLLAKASDVDPVPRISSDDIYLIRHTAGTTGRSKGVAFTQWRWMATVRDWLFNLPPMLLDDAFLHQSPISHGSGYFFTPAWMNGARNVMLEKLVPDQVLDMVEQERITHMLGIPTILRSILRDPSIQRRDLSSVKAIMISGAPVSEDTARTAYEVFGDALHVGFGQTEINPITFMTAKEWFEPGAGPERLLSAGRAQPFGEIKVVDPFTRDNAASGVEGEIAARSDGQMVGFWDDPESTRARIEDGWILTGDVGRIDEHGYLFIMDRAGNMIVSGGFNIYPAELENVISGHPAIQEVAVFSVPSEKWGESPAAVCVVDDVEAVTAEEIIELCSRKLGSYKKPSTVVIRTEPLPKNAVGKILRKVLREPYWEGYQRRVSGS